MTRSGRVDRTSASGRKVALCVAVATAAWAASAAGAAAGGQPDDPGVPATATQRSARTPSAHHTELRAVRVATAEDGLTVSGTYTYTLDPAADVVHVVADMAFTNTVPNKVSGAYIDKTYYTGYNTPVPVEAVGLAATQNGSAIVLTPNTIDPDLPFYVVGIEFARHLFYHQTASVVLTYDIPGSPARDENPTRVNDAYAAFDAYGVADPGALTVQVVVPAGYVIDTFGSDAVQTVDELGNTVYTATGIAEPEQFDLFVSARNDAALATEEHPVGSSDFVVKSWPNDVDWRNFIVDHLDRGVPALADLIGQPWPETEPVEISEAVTSYLYGYAGWYDSREKAVELGEDLDAQTVVHELAHAWFNDRWFEDRWLNEGLADEYSSLANEQLGDDPASPEKVDLTDAAALPLNSWSPTIITDDDNDLDEESYGYNAAWFVIDGIVDDVGVDGMRDVFAAIDADRISYVGDAAPEELVTAQDWRRFLDLVDNAASSSVADDLMARYVVTPDQAKLLTDRSAARDAYDALAEQGDEWAPPLVVRKQMSWWRFDDAGASMKRSTEALTKRDSLAGTLADIGVPMDPAIEAEYEQAAASLDSTIDMLDDTIEEADAVVTARDDMTDALHAAGVTPASDFTASYVEPDSTLAEVAAGVDELDDAIADLDATIDLVDADRSLLQRVGLWRTDVDEPVVAAKAALAHGDIAQARIEAARARALIADSTDVGRTRVIVAACVVGGVLLVLVVVVVLVVRRRRRRRTAAAVVAELSTDDDAPVEQPAEVTAGWLPPFDAERHDVLPPATAVDPPQRGDEP